jgi:uncharacterized RDD family membrane protein YckC
MAWFDRPQPQLETEGDVIWRRVVAVIIDVILVGIVVTPISSAVFGGPLSTAASLLTMILTFAYYIFLEGNYGQTIGKMALGIVVVTEDGDPIEYEKAAIRTVLRIVDILPAFYIVGLILVLVTDKKQRLGDLAADTIVVRAQ